MTVTATNLTAGPGRLWVGAFGVTEPTDTVIQLTADPSTGWTDVGGTEGGVSIKVKNEFFQLEVDQIIDPVGSRLKGRSVTVETTLSEMTLDNLLLAMASGTKTSGTGYATLDPSNDNSATQATYKALCFDGWAPGSVNAWRRRLIVRKVLNTEGVTGWETKKDGQDGLKVTFLAHYVSSSILPFHVIDQTA